MTARQRSHEPGRVCRSSTLLESCRVARRLSGSSTIYRLKCSAAGIGNPLTGEVTMRSHISRVSKVVLTLVILGGYQLVSSQGSPSYNGFDLVDKTGNIRKPSDYRDKFQAFGVY